MYNFLIALDMVSFTGFCNHLMLLQGMTLDCVEMSLGRCFEDGQAYVALSRAKSLQSLRVKDFNPVCVRAKKEVLDFYRALRQMRRNYIEDGML